MLTYLSLIGIFMAFDNYLQFHNDLTPPSDVSVAKKVFKENSNVNGHWLTILEGCHIQGLKKRKRVSRRFPFASRGVSLEANRGVSPRRS
ncbi:hypothetical protein HanRHA438_Chr05g0235461 [Helianthus annuus]|nr:hypothetical protein HanRHA438_Chr05g0235461 [Helianthus annuus]